MRVSIAWGDDRSLFREERHGPPRCSDFKLSQDHSPIPSDPSIEQWINALLARQSAGEDGVRAQLWSEIYADVHRLARSILAREGPRQRIDTTVLVHEVYLKMGGATFDNRKHLFGSLVRMMGQILVDSARRGAIERRAGERPNSAHRALSLDTTQLGLSADATGEMSVRVVDALDRLDRLAPRSAVVARLRFVGGLTVEQVAICLDISERTVKSDWAFARAWMHRELSGAGELPRNSTKQVGEATNARDAKEENE